MPDTTQSEDNMDILLVENLMLRDKLARAMKLLEDAVNLTEIQGQLIKGLRSDVDRLVQIARDSQAVAERAIGV